MWLTASTTCSKARTCCRWRSSRCLSPSSVSSRTPVRFPRRSSRTSAPPRATSSSPTSYSSESVLWFFPQGLHRGLPDAPRGFPHLPGLRPSPTSNSSEFLLWLYPQGLQQGLPDAPRGLLYLPALSPSSPTSYSSQSVLWLFQYVRGFFKLSAIAITILEHNIENEQNKEKKLDCLLYKK